MENRETLRNSLERKKQLEYLSSVATERDRVSSQIEQLKRQIGQLTQKLLDLDKEWRGGILSVSATSCPSVETPQKSKKKNSLKLKQMNQIEKKLKSADSEQIQMALKLLKNAGIEVDL